MLVFFLSVTNSFDWSETEKQRKNYKKNKKNKNSDLPDSNQRPKDVCYEFPTTVLRSTNWAKVG
jgi:hypothetical protein